MEAKTQIVMLISEAQKESAEFSLNCQNQLLKQLRNINPIDEETKKFLQDTIETTIKVIAKDEAALKMIELFTGIFQKLRG